MRINDVHSIMQSLSGKRLAFCSEADFQFSLAREIDSYYGQRNIPAQIYLEWPINITNTSNPKQRYYLDILVVIGNEAFPIELKYSPAEGKINDQGRLIDLRDQFAYDLVRYGYLKDIDRISTIKSLSPAAFGDSVVYHRGFAIILTNDRNFYDVPRNNALNTLDGYFRIHDRSRPSKVCYPVPGNVMWNSPPPGHWTTTHNYAPFMINPSISTQWMDYSRVSDLSNVNKIHVFRYLVNEIV